MAERCLFYYITERTAFGGDERERRRQLIDKISEAAANGIDYIQLREKDLSTRDLELLAREAMSAIRQQSKLSATRSRPGTALLINSRIDVAIAVSADGVHLRACDVSPRDVRRMWREGTERQSQSLGPEPLITVSCHSQEDVARAATNGADFALFAPVFEKKGAESVPAGIDGLQRACREKIHVFALGGVSLENAGSCLRAGAVGIAGIRLFQENEISKVVPVLRELRPTL